MDNTIYGFIRILFTVTISIAINNYLISLYGKKAWFKRYNNFTLTKSESFFVGFIQTVIIIIIFYLITYITQIFL